MMAMTMADDGVAPDGLLAARARDGDRAAFAALVERHYDFIFRVAFRLTGRRDAAEDVAQDVCVRLGRAISGYRGAVVLNAARDALRRSSREAVRAHAFGTHVALFSADAAEPDDPAEALWAAVRELPDKQREAVTLVYGEGLSHAEAAEALGIAEPTVSWHVHEAKKRLKALLRPAGDERR